MDNAEYLSTVGISDSVAVCPRTMELLSEIETFISGHHQVDAPDSAPLTVYNLLEWNLSNSNTTINKQ